MSLRQPAIFHGGWDIQEIEQFLYESERSR